MSEMTAEMVFKGFTLLSRDERTRFFELLAADGRVVEHYSHEQVFGDLLTVKFTASEAAEYLEIPISTFCRYVSEGRIQACEDDGQTEMFAARNLKAFKLSLKESTSA